jgi:hopanoid biosynthesis associated protein HpnK
MASAGRQIIFSADDFGLSAGVNAGILRAHRDGILTNASLMVNGAAFVEAVQIARDHPSLAVGLHLVLLQGKSTLAPEQIPMLVNRQGMFRNHPVWVGLRYFFTPGMHRQLESEICAQLEKFAASGLPLSHVDGHLNIHMHPSVLNILLQQRRRFGIGAMRLPREPMSLSLRADSREPLRKRIEAITFAQLDRYARPKLQAAQVRHVDQLFGLHNSGHITETFLLRVLAELPHGVTEIYTHASLVDAEARRWRPANYECEDELKALTSIRVRAALEAAGIERISYRSLLAAGDR